MKIVNKVLTSVYIAFVICCLLNLFMGEYGLRKYNEMTIHEKNIEKNIDVLRDKNQELSMKFRSLINNPDAVIMEARGLNYYAENEGMLNMSSMRNGNEYSEMIGEIRWCDTVEADHDTFIRTAAISAFLLTLILLIVFFKNENNRNNCK